MIQDTFESAILLRLYPRAQIDIYVEVLQADGGVLPAAINAATLALVDAGVPMLDLVCACTAGLVEGEPILDLNYAEEASDCAAVPLAILLSKGSVVTLAMQARMNVDLFQRVIDLASIGCNQVASRFRSSSLAADDLALFFFSFRSAPP